MMSRFTDPVYLTTEQYRDSSNLNARMALHERFSVNPYGWLNWVFDALSKLPNDARILELGCGNGELWKVNSKRIPLNWDITLSDLSDGMLDSAWRNLVVTARAFKFERVNAQAIPYKDETFDAVIANHMLYHVPDRPKAIEEMKRVLKRGGRLFATTVGKDHLREINPWLTRASGKSFESFANPFVLENGLEQLSPFFSRVEMSRYHDDLRVTEIAPLMAYIRSTLRAAELSQEEFERIERELATELRDNGAVFIHKDSGLFEAVK